MKGKKGVWIKVAKEQAKLVPVAIEVSFQEKSLPPLPFYGAEALSRWHVL